MKPQADRYAYRVIWSDEDEEFVGLCAEFPSLSWLAPSQAEALNGIVRAVDGILEDMSASSEPIPEPLAAKKYSGVIKVRLSPQQHRKLSMEAAEEKMSLNRLVVSKLAHV